MKNFDTEVVYFSCRHPEDELVSRKSQNVYPPSYLKSRFLFLRTEVFHRAFLTHFSSQSEDFVSQAVARD